MKNTQTYRENVSIGKVIITKSTINDETFCEQFLLKLNTIRVNNFLNGTDVSSSILANT